MNWFDSELKKYIRIREATVLLFTKVSDLIPQELFVQAARDLEMIGLDGQTLMLEREEDIDFVADRAIHDIPWPILRQQAPLFIIEFMRGNIRYLTQHVTEEMVEKDKVLPLPTKDSFPSHSKSKTVGRNDPCPCGSRKKYKKCCLSKDEDHRGRNSVWSLVQRHHLIRSADDYPVEQCLINDVWKQSRLAQIVVMRRIDENQLLFGVFFVDIGCLGVKSAFCNAGFTAEQLRSGFLDQLSLQQTMIPIGLQYAKEIIEGAVEYARRLGFYPDPDFELARYVLGQEPVVASHEVQFGGDDGKPLYVVGPNDDVDEILRQLTQRVGQDGFQYIAPVDLYSEV